MEEMRTELNNLRTVVKTTVQECDLHDDREAWKAGPIRNTSYALASKSSITPFLRRLVSKPSVSDEVVDSLTDQGSSSRTPCNLKKYSLVRAYTFTSTPGNF